MSFYRSADRVAIVPHHEHIQVEYVSSVLSPVRGERTFWRLVASPSAGEAWIAFVQVNLAFRRMGLGRQLVLAAEQIALELSIREVNVWPLMNAVPFWERLDFQPHSTKSRVMYKLLGQAATRQPSQTQHS